jgi:twitching motility protein PilT
MPRIDAFLKLGREQGCSDIHFTVGLPPLVRLDGELTPLKYRELSSEEISSIVREVLDPPRLAHLDETGSVDFSYSAEGSGRFRVNACKQHRGLSAICRVIPEKVPTLTELGLPPVISRFTGLRSGMVLVTGAAGTGKSTTLAAMVDEINRNQNQNIITLEDPIEFVHQSQKSLVIQREIGSHLHGFGDGLRAALRQDPDVILVGELRDYESTRAGLTPPSTAWWTRSRPRPRPRSATPSPRPSSACSPRSWSGRRTAAAGGRSWRSSL